VKQEETIHVTVGAPPIELPMEAQERHTGYVLRWNGLKGLILDSESDEEYPVLAGDLLCSDSSNLHCLESVEFSLLADDDDNLRATHVSKPGLERIQHVWRKSQRRGKEAPVGDERYVGYVEKYEKNHHGFIVFKTDAFRNIYFPEIQLQTTGDRTVAVGSEIEFEVRKKDGKIQAQNITMVGEGLITYETGSLGKMLRGSDMKLEHRKHLEPNSEERVRGIVGEWHAKDEVGIIWPIGGYLRIVCKAEDITSTGFKMLRPETEVEFTAVKENNDLKATNVTGPNETPYMDATIGPIYDHFLRIKKSYEKKRIFKLGPRNQSYGMG